MNSGPQVEVGIVSVDPLRRIGLQAILEEVVGLNSRADSLEDALAADDLAAVLLDSRSVDDVVHAVVRFRRERPGVKLIVLGEGQDPAHIQTVIGAGANGYLPESATEAEIRMAMDVVLDGSVWAPRKVLARLIEAGGVKAPPGARPRRFVDQMTARELEVLHLLKDGRSNKQIAQSMGVESVTVKAHLGRMLRKAGVKNRVALTLKALAED